MKKRKSKKSFERGMQRLSHRVILVAPLSIPAVEALSQRKSRDIGYSDEDLKALPEGANLGFGCGNPVAVASLKKGETVLDLGSGAGIDCFLAAEKVGRIGKVIGVDMMPRSSPLYDRVDNSIVLFEATAGFAARCNPQVCSTPVRSLCQETQCFRLPLAPPSSYVGELPNSHRRT